MGLGLILPLAPSFGAASRRAFDIPAGDAAATLKLFAAQSGAQLLYSPDDVAHVRTQAVHGDLEPSTALARMLAHTPLRAREDPTTKAFSITVNRPARAPPKAEAMPRHPDTSPNLSPNQPKDFPSVKPHHFLLLVAGWLVASTAADAQPSSPSLKSHDTVTLSPFTVSTERDTGFVAASSLAGGRLAGDLRDTPVAYSVITRDFIDALGLTNVSDAAAWMPNTVEMISGLGGGQGEDIYNAPGNFNVRGSGVGRGQRNFFNYTAPNDSYAVERFDFSRGPNAILFGNGSLGGVATTTTKQARFDRAFNEVSQRFGSYSDSRTTVDFNRPLGRNAAAPAIMFMIRSPARTRSCITRMIPSRSPAGPIVARRSPVTCRVRCRRLAVPTPRFSTRIMCPKVGSPTRSRARLFACQPRASVSPQTRLSTPKVSRISNSPSIKSWVRSIFRSRPISIAPATYPMRWIAAARAIPISISIRCCLTALPILISCSLTPMPSCDARWVGIPTTRVASRSVTPSLPAGGVYIRAVSSAVLPIAAQRVTPTTSALLKIRIAAAGEPPVPRLAPLISCASAGIGTRNSARWTFRLRSATSIR